MHRENIGSLFGPFIDLHDTAGKLDGVSLEFLMNEAGEAITETLPAFTVDTAGTVTGSKAFKTITSITITRTPVRA